MPDLSHTPGIYYALAYWLSCTFYIAQLPRRLDGWRLVAVQTGFLAAIAGFMVATDGVPMLWFLPCVSVYVTLMLLDIKVCCGLDWLKTGYVCIQAFILGEFAYGGVLVSCGGVGLPGVPDVAHAHMCTGNTHGSVIEVAGKHYVFYHRHSNRKQSSRQACAEQIRFENGKFYQAEMTSCGLNGGPLAGEGCYPAYAACNVYGRSGTRFLSMVKHRKSCDPFLTQWGGTFDFLSFVLK